MNLDPGACVTEPSWGQPQTCSLPSITRHLAVAGPPWKKVKSMQVLFLIPRYPARLMAKATSLLQKHSANVIGLKKARKEKVLTL